MDTGIVTQGMVSMYYGMYDIPNNEAFAPPEIATMISSYGSMASSACYNSPDNGSHSYSMPLQEAMDEYGNMVLYRVVVDVFSDNQMLEANSEAVKKEMERLSELEYTVAFEKFTDGTINTSLLLYSSCYTRTIIKLCRK